MTVDPKAVKRVYRLPDGRRTGSRAKWARAWGRLSDEISGALDITVNACDPNLSISDRDSPTDCVILPTWLALRIVEKIKDAASQEGVKCGDT